MISMYFGVAKVGDRIQLMPVEGWNGKEYSQPCGAYGTLVGFGTSVQGRTTTGALKSGIYANRFEPRVRFDGSGQCEPANLSDFFPGGSGGVLAAPC